MIPNLQTLYLETIRPQLKAERGYVNINEVPRLEKIVLNMGVNDALDNEKNLDAALEELTLIVGQKPVKTVARKAIAAFKLRKGLKIGGKVCLRRQRMYEFLERFIKVALPRVRDFRGVNPRSFDGRGNYAIGIKEQLIFPEINFERVEKIRGMDIIFVTTAKTDEEAKALLEKFGMPFRKK